ncbi:hypothetical protein K7W42_10280 [Deinococcus sp. HMF7604]|uniref:hypothetical protein n=1 Tax=Deinococcus betulae TaxID=2873312 RepID=UPI001CCEA2EC|nr:hypothetical protein [Deinococcus betulae]MBZ9751251.1 hypothetical protein [Deinococcus betulae]
MVRALLAVSLLLPPSVALAGGSQNAQPRAVAPFGAPAAHLPVKPGQTWILSGTAANGQKLSREVVLTAKAATWEGDSWDFDSELGGLSYTPQDGSFYAGDFSGGLVAGGDVVLCLGFLEGRTGRGALLVGTLDEIKAETDKLDADLPDPRTTEEALATMRAAGLKVGTCTLTLKK